MIYEFHSLFRSWQRGFALPAPPLIFLTELRPLKLLQFLVRISRVAHFQDFVFLHQRFCKLAETAALAMG